MEKKPKHSANKEVRILPSGNVEIEPCPLSKGANDKVRWVSETGPWAVTFRTSPFEKVDTFRIGEGGGKSAWSPKIKRAAWGRFKYTVTGLRRRVDPNIIIR